MTQFKTNDIVTPSTPIKKEQLGKGIVVETHPMITVIFPSKHATYLAVDFKEDYVEIAEAKGRKLLQIQKAGYTYNMLMEELKSV